MESELGIFEGKPVEEIRIIVRKTGDGLSETMKIDPQLLEHGDNTGVLILGEVSDVNFPRHKYEQDEEDREGVDRVQVIQAQGAILLPADSPELAAVRKVIQQVRERQKAERDAKKNQLTIAGTEPPTK